MTNEQLIALRRIGVDMDEINERFLGNVDMFEKFLRKFLSETNYPKLLDAIKAENVQDAFAAAHALKGVSANLSLKLLYNVVAEQVEFLREGNLRDALPLMPAVTSAYQETVAFLHAVLQE